MPAGNRIGEKRMKKHLLILLVLVLALGAFAACTKRKKNDPTPTPTATPTATPTEAPTPTPEGDVDVKGEGVMTYAQYIAAEDDDEILIECYVQATQSWWEDKISVYAADRDGGYFIYNMLCSEEDAKKLVPGTKIRVKGYRATWSGEIEVAKESTFEFLEGSYIAPVKDVTAYLGTKDLINYQNLPVSFKDLVIVSDVTYKWDNSGNPGDDLYFKVALGENVFTFTVESYLCGKDTDVYKAVEKLEIGDIVDLEGFLYWYNGVNPHITKATVKGNVSDKSEGALTHAQYIAAADEDEVVIECYVQATHSWWEDKISVYAADTDGGYFIYNMKCSEEDAKKLVPGTKIRVKGYRATWAGENEIAKDSTFEILEGRYVAPSIDVTNLLGTDDLFANQNLPVAFKGLTVTGAATYKWDNSGNQGDDLYFKVSYDGKEYTFTVESDLCSKDTDVYKAVEALKVGDVIDLEGFLYWYNGANPHITKVTPAAK